MCEDACVHTYIHPHTYDVHALTYLGGNLHLVRTAYFIRDSQ